MTRGFKVGVLSGFICILVSGCYPSIDDLAPTAADQPWKVSQPIDASKTADPLAQSSAASSSAAKKFELPSGLSVPYRRDEVEVDQGHVYDLPELIDLAEQNNPDTRIAWERSKQAAYGVGLAKSTYLPEISAEILGGEQHTPAPIPKSVEARGYFDANTNEALPSLVIKWLLFDFGKRDSILKASRQASLASNIAFTGEHQKLIFEVSKAYFALDAERAQLKVAEDAMKSSKTLAGAADAKGKSGLGTSTEVALTRRGLAKAEFDLAEARSVDNDAYHALLEAIGLTPTLKMKIAYRYGRALPQNLGTDVKAYIERALAMRPDIAAAYAKVEASEAEMSGAEASYYPTLGLEGVVNQNIGSVSVDGGPSYRVNEPAAAILLRLKLPLYDGGLRANTLGIARSKNAEAKEELNKAQDEAIRQVARAYDTVKSSLAQYKAALALEKASTNANEAAYGSYRQGVGTLTDAVSSETDLTQAEAAKAHAYASVMTAAAALAFSTGDLTSIDALQGDR